MKDLEQTTFDNPAVAMIEEVRKWEKELKEKGWDEAHLKQIIRNRIRRANRKKNNV